LHINFKAAVAHPHDVDAAALTSIWGQ